MFKKAALFSLLVAAGLSAQASDYFVVVPVKGKTVNASAIDVALSPYASLPLAVVGFPYSGFDFKPLLAVTGDSGYTGYGLRWSVVGGALPAGLTLDESTGVVSGTPTAQGTASFTVMASYKTKMGSQSYQIVSANVTVGLTSATLTRGTVGEAYSYDLKPLLTVSGVQSFDATNAAWSLASGALPAGLTLNSNGTITGTPTAAGTATATIKATYLAKDGTQTYQLVTVSFTNLLLMHFDGDRADASPSARSSWIYGTAPAYSTDAKFGQSISLTGAGFVCLAPFNMLEPVTSNFTMEFWTKTSAYANAGLLTQHQHGSALGWYLGTYTDGSIYLMEDPHSYTRARSAANALKLNVWQHIALVRNNGTVKAYIDGKEVFSTTSSVSSFYTGSGTYGNIAIGGGACNVFYQPYNGKMDEVRFTQGARYTAEFTPPAAPGN